ncbi:MAG: helix-turn-helix domain-containing protein [Clostridiales bacterium]|nr:helix-turn-helix domain-containing protein [Clostridiales bacterium]
MNNSDESVRKSGLSIYSKKDLLEIFPFGHTKLQQLLNAGVLPVVKVGRSYLSSDEMINRWLSENVGKTIFY